MRDGDPPPRLSSSSTGTPEIPYAINDESLKAYLAPTGLVSEPRGDLTCRGVEFREFFKCPILLCTSSLCPAHGMPMELAPMLAELALAEVVLLHNQFIGFTS